MHVGPSRRFVLCLAGLLIAGCAEPLPLREANAPLLEAIAAVAPVVDGPKPPAPSVVSSPYVESPYLNQGAPPPEAASYAAAPPSAAPPGQADAVALQKIMAELQSLGTIDPATQRQLLTDLQQTDPALWPMLMQTFRAGMTYRQKQPPAATVPEPEPTTTVAAAPPKVSNVGASAVPSVDMAAMTTSPRGASSSPGLTFPATSLLNAALSEAQRQEAAAAEPPPPAVGEPSATPAPSEVRPTSHAQPVADLPKVAPADWRKSIEQTIAALENETKEPPHSAHEVTRHAWLRVLYLAAGRRDDALKPIPGIAAVEQDFWSEQLYALATYLETEKITDPARRSAEAARHLSKATSRLSEAATLSVKNLAFCTEVSSYGVYQKFKSEDFTANQPLILYAEVENYKSEETAKGFHTALRSSYQILDAQGRRVAENDLALTEEYCQNLRRDYFLRYFLSVPERIYAGKYVLQLTIVDTLSQKIGQSSIEFTVVEK